MLCLSGFELYSRWVPLFYLILLINSLRKSTEISEENLYADIGALKES